VTRGDRTNSQGRQEATTPEKKRGQMRVGSVKRGGQVEALPDGRQRHDEKLRLRQQRTRGNTTASRGRQEALEQGWRLGRVGGDDGIKCSINI
jgi:hypothetical protein